MFVILTSYVNSKLEPYSDSSTISALTYELPPFFLLSKSETDTAPAPCVDTFSGFPLYRMFPCAFVNFTFVIIFSISAFCFGVSMIPKFNPLNRYLVFDSSMFKIFFSCTFIFSPEALLTSISAFSFDLFKAVFTLLSSVHSIVTET